ncbi:FAD-binding oxidoreductase [Aeromicrobium fastidiosum]|uniref:3-ketosteroid-9-alpha-hydroxylase n=1 Tax=Aeromicrobium fastidiosum TaxID=52699 RepID=A0A641AP62_9ACTN|nr:FAD-binding oxidoreductase [Aeromicrobium fastidiosum]KAA1379880.1 3-ketosteroid-9-alpha-hydroxylase [Aeromicrobium fastidiosum]MBP2389384.1 ferredoxin-NADP reductase [Aeromicrobium fastidiosum]
MPVRSFDLDVVDVTDETADAVCVTFAIPVGAESDFTYRPGQFLTLEVPGDTRGQVARCYSLCSSPAEPGGTISIGVKRTVGGYASNWICDSLRPGQRIRTLPPMGAFTPTSFGADLLLLAGGSGITPILSILRTALLKGSSRIVMAYANRDRDSIMFDRALAELSHVHRDRIAISHWLDSETGPPTIETVETWAIESTSFDAFVCGPPPFMDVAAEALGRLGLPRERVHQERFISLRANPFDSLPVAPRASTA